MFYLGWISLFNYLYSDKKKLINNNIYENSLELEVKLRFGKNDINTDKRKLRLRKCNNILAKETLNILSESIKP